MAGEDQGNLLPNGWELGSIGRDAVVKGRIGWRGYKKSDLRASGPVVIGGINVKSHLFLDLSEVKHISREKFEESPDIQLVKGDVLLVQRGNGLADTAYFDGSIPEATINPTLIVLSEFTGDPRFLFYYLTSPDGRQRVLSLASGSSVPAIYQNQLKQLTYPRPPAGEQFAICEVLSRLDHKIELNRLMNETLENLGRALFKSWFVDFDPVRAKAEGSEPLLPRWVAELFPDSFETFDNYEIPKGWAVLGLDKTGRFLNGLALQKFPPQGDHFLPVIKIAQLRTEDTSDADKASADLSPEYIVEDGDVLFSWSGSLECVLWAGGRGALNQHLFKVTSNTYPKWFYYLWIHTHLPEFRRIASGKATTMGHIQRGHLTAAKVVVPPPEILKQMDRFFAPLINRTINLKLASRTLAAIREALLPKLISGELRVPDAERIVGGQV